MDQNISKIISENLDIDFINIVISNSANGSELTKVKVRPIMLKGELLYQASEYRGKQIFHSNYTKEQFIEKLPDWLDDLLKQVQMITQSKQISILISKKGKVTIKSKKNKESDLQFIKSASLSHNREKTYVLQEGRPVPFLVDLGIMTDEGKIVKSKYDKFKQINRFLEFIEDIVPSLAQDRELTIIDFGCGKSYLTFAMYYYLKELRNYQIRVIGLDLKKDVINHCNQLAMQYGYDKLSFLEGDIATYEGVSKVDMIVTLHACDTATDYALFKAIGWDADVILSVPCCQHELNEQINSELLNPILHYGLIKERVAALATDALRAELLEAVGYKTQILEFIDMEHTPKNILLRAVKKTRKIDDSFEEMQRTGTISSEKLVSIEACRKFLGVEPTLYKLLLEHYPLT